MYDDWQRRNAAYTESKRKWMTMLTMDELQRTLTLYGIDIHTGKQVAMYPSIDKLNDKEYCDNLRKMNRIALNLREIEELLDE